ncbi:MAG: PFL family protein [Thermoprotei archaeon]
MRYTAEEILDVFRMLREEDLDIRSVTLSVNTAWAISDRLERALEKLEGLRDLLERFSTVVDEVADKYGVKVVTKRVAVTPVQFFLEPLGREAGVEIARLLDSLAKGAGIDYISGYSAFVDRGFTRGSRAVIDTLAKAMESTERVTGMINAASTFTGLNFDAVKLFADQLFEMSPKSSSRVAIMSNVPPDSPFVPSAIHGLGMPEASINVAVSGPGVIKGALERSKPRTLQEAHEVIKKAAFKVTRLGELVGRKVAERLEVSFGAVDLSLAPSPNVGDSVAEIIEAMGVSKVGGHGSLTALAVLMDAVKKGGAMATSHVGGLSGAFVPVSEDSVMAQRALEGHVGFYQLLAFSAVCNTGIDMVGVSKSQGKDKVIALISDVLSLGITLNKTLGVRLIPVDSPPGTYVDLGGLLGRVAVVKLEDVDVSKFASLGGFFPTTVKRLEIG